MKEPIKKTFSVKEVCPSCGGTGVYIGPCEGDGTAVVCCVCKGTGCHEFTRTYEVFTKRKTQLGVKRVYKTSAGYMIGGTNLEDFGGVLFISKS